MTPHSDFDQHFRILKRDRATLLGPWSGNVWRGTKPQWMSEPYRMTGAGAVLMGGRWNVRKLMPALYFSTDPLTQAAEASAEARRNGFPANSLCPQTVVPFALSLSQMLDLTAAPVRKALGLSTSALTSCAWHAEQVDGREPVTQALARAAFETLFEGLVVPSAQRRGGLNVIVFPSHLAAGSTVVALNAKDVPFVHGL